MRYWILALFIGLVAAPSVRCTHAPPQLGPVAAADFQKLRVIKALDLLRDFAIDAEAATPKVLPTATTRQIVTYHASALRILDAAGTGWRPLLASSLAALTAAVPAADRATVAPYIALIQALLSEVS